MKYFNMYICHNTRTCMCDTASVHDLIHNINIHLYAVVKKLRRLDSSLNESGEYIFVKSYIHPHARKEHLRF